MLNYVNITRVRLDLCMEFDKTYLKWGTVNSLSRMYHTFNSIQETFWAATLYEICQKLDIQRWFLPLLLMKVHNSNGTHLKVNCLHSPELRLWHHQGSSFWSWKPWNHPWFFFSFTSFPIYGPTTASQVQGIFPPQCVLTWHLPLHSHDPFSRPSPSLAWTVPVASLLASLRPDSHLPYPC